MLIAVSELLDITCHNIVLPATRPDTDERVQHLKGVDNLIPAVRRVLDLRIYLSRKDKRLSWPWRLVKYCDCLAYLPAYSRLVQIHGLFYMFCTGDWIVWVWVCVCIQKCVGWAAGLESSARIPQKRRYSLQVSKPSVATSAVNTSTIFTF